MTWQDGDIEGVEIRPLRMRSDERGWLAEVYRGDEIAPGLMPAMSYISVTDPGITRGPHEHRHQTDLFTFFDGEYALHLWDGRDQSPTRGKRKVIRVGSGNACVVIIPPGVVHAYKNTGEKPAYVFNCPNTLYAGPGKSEPVDEIRHEDLPDSPYVLD